MKSPFHDDWRDSLKAYYKHIAREDNTVATLTLPNVMHQAGFTDADLRQLEIEATMHVDDVPDGHTPTFHVHPAECTCGACVISDEEMQKNHNEYGQPKQEHLLK